MTYQDKRWYSAAALAVLLVSTACGTASGPDAVPTSTPSKPTSTAEPATTIPTSTSEPEPREFTIVATGDVLLHERLWTQAKRDAHADGTWNFAPQLASIAPIVNGADLSICHLETPVAPEGGPYQGYPLFSAPPQIVPSLAETGYTACTVASNHTFDQGAAGVDRTLEALDAAGLAAAGAARTPDEADQPSLIEVATDGGPVMVALLSYTYGFNGLPYPDGNTWRGNVIDPEAILDEASRARDAGAEFVVLALHWGTEYSHDPNEHQRELAPELIASPDIDLMLGHHAHVVQPMERFGEEWVVYGLGNLMHAQKRPPDPRHEGLLVRFTIREGKDGAFLAAAAEYLPLYQTNELPVSVVDVAAALEGGDTGTASVARLERAMDRTTEIVGSRGALDDGLELLSE